MSTIHTYEIGNDLYMVNDLCLELTTLHGTVTAGSTYTTPNATYNQELNAYVLEVDLDKLSSIDALKGVEFTVELTGTLKHYTKISGSQYQLVDTSAITYDDHDIFLFRNFDFEDLITPEDIIEAKEMIQRWLGGTMSDEDKVIWNAGLRGCLNSADINNYQTLFYTILNSFYAQRYNTSVSIVNFYNEIMGGSHYLVASGFETMRNKISAEIITNWYSAKTNAYEKSRYSQELRKLGNYYFGAVPAASKYNDYRAWNDIEKLLRIFYTVLVYDEASYRDAWIVDYTPPEPFVYYNYLYMTGEEDEELYASTASVDDNIGII